MEISSDSQQKTEYTADHFTILLKRIIDSNKQFSTGTFTLKLIIVNEHLALQDSIFSGGHKLIFEDCEFKGFVISGQGDSDNFKLEQLLFRRCKLDRFQFSDAKTKSLISLQDSELDGCEIGYCTLQEVSLYNCKVKGIYFSGTIINDVTLEKLTCLSLGINDGGMVCKFLNTLQINSGTYKEIIFYESFFNKVRIERVKYESLKFFAQDYTTKVEDALVQSFFISHYANNIVLNNFNFGELTFYHCSNDKTDIDFRNVKVNKLKFENFINDGNLKINRLRTHQEDSSFEIIDSYLGKAYLWHVNFRSFSNGIILNTDLNEIKVNNVLWHLDINKNNLEQRVEVYRQLKLLTNSKGDKTQSLELEKVEMDALNSKLKWSFNLNVIDEKLILWSNKVSNSFGQNWLKPTTFLFGFAFLFYILIELIVCTPAYINCFPRALQNCGLFLQYLDPTHKTENLNPEIKNSNSALFLDFLSRVVSSYFIFQIIIAFRRYSRK